MRKSVADELKLDIKSYNGPEVKAVNCNKLQYYEEVSVSINENRVNCVLTDISKGSLKGMNVCIHVNCLSDRNETNNNSENFNKMKNEEEFDLNYFQSNKTLDLSESKESVNNESHTVINVCTEKNDKWVNACRDGSNGNSLSENEFQSNEINANCLKSTVIKLYLMCNAIECQTY
jgi:hypothetical protein